MKKLFYLTVLTLISLPTVSFSAFNDTTLTTDAVILVNGHNLNVSGSSAVIESISVNESDFSVTLSSGSSITITSPTRNQLHSDVSSDVTSNICNNSTSSLSLSYSGVGNITNVITPLETICTDVPAVITPPTPSPSSRGSIVIRPIIVSTTTTATSSTPSTTSPVVPPYSPYVPQITNDLKLNMTGSQVSILQQSLYSLGYLKVLPTGYFGNLTLNAVKLYQRANLIPDTGYVGALTRASLNNIKVISAPNTNVSMTTKYIFTKDLSIGMTDSEVKTLQEYLNSKGFIVSTNGAGSQSNESNYFGEKTKQALIKYQKSNNLPATGFFGRMTRGSIRD